VGVHRKKHCRLHIALRSSLLVIATEPMLTIMNVGERTKNLLAVQNTSQRGEWDHSSLNS
jgi:hypothetical protein